jgi:polyphosphate kinase
VRVDLIVRGACALVPGVRGLSDRIRVISVVDRFLEHSRIYAFGDSKVIYLSSADWMPRNFFSRLELAFPVLDPRIFRFLDEVVIATYLSDSAKANELTPQGTWRRIRGDGVRSQVRFQEIAAAGYRGTPLE